jgi:uncharacterized sulfatase
MLAALVGLAVSKSPAVAQTASPQRPPNVVVILADDLGYGDLGCYGQKVIQTPRLDRMAAEGIRLTQFYAGSCVCAPSRYVLMTGTDTGRGHVRGNGGEGISSLKKNDDTIPKFMKRCGYRTALCGKWGLGAAVPGNEGLPRDQGFDLFFGYLNQTHAHNYYPDFLWLDEQKQQLPNIVPPLKKSPGGVATKKVEYSADLIRDKAFTFIRDCNERKEPFFLYWASTNPHANNEAKAATGNGQEVPDEGIYAGKPWPAADRGQAAMISRLDSDVGQLFDLLSKLGIDDNTLVLFSSDNGPHHEGGQDTERFDPNGPLRGMKRDLYEGGIRVPLVARWPGRIKAGQTSDHISYLGDVFATLAELASPQPWQSKAPMNSISFLPTLTGRAADQKEHEFLYWEFYEQGSKQAVRAKNWKAVRMPMLTGKIELYDLSADIGEAKDIAAENPDIVRRMEQLMAEAHVPDSNWPVVADEQKTKERKNRRAAERQK